MKNLKMKKPYIHIALLITNLSILFLLVTGQKKADNTEVTPVLRANLIELIDEKGNKRASLTAYPDGETVFRIMDKKGEIRVKLGGGEDGSGLVLLDGDTNPGVHVLSKIKGVSLALTDKSGKQQILKP
jgi:hypothetical protein